MKYGYKVSIDSYGGHERREEGRYASWESSQSNKFGRISVCDKHPDVVSDFEFKKGDDVFVVWIEYSTGNSFGRAYRGSTEVMGVFKDKKAAKELRDAIENHDKKSDANTMDKYEFKCDTSDGQRFKCPAYWIGYFERLEEVHIESTEIRGERA